MDIILCLITIIYLYLLICTCIILYYSAHSSESIEEFCDDLNLNLIGKTFMYFFLLPLIICKGIFYIIKKIFTFHWTKKEK